MTIVIAKRNETDVLILSDTMVGEPGKLGPDVMPGRLKTIIVAPRVTIAYAGNADAADVVIRHGRKEYLRSGIVALIEMLSNESANGETDYILVAHDEGLIFKLIRRGAAVDVPDICAIGDLEPFRDLIAANTGNSIVKFQSSDFRLRFVDRMMTNKDLGDHIGGFPISLLASPDAHKYLKISGGYTYKFDIIWGQETHQSIDQVYTGDGHFQLSVMPPEKNDVPVVAVCLLQARTGYVYSPLEQPWAFRITLAPHEFAWEGHENELYQVLIEAVEAHVEAVLRLAH